MDIVPTKQIIKPVAFADIQTLVRTEQFNANVIVPFHYCVGKHSSSEISGFLFSSHSDELKTLRSIVGLTDIPPRRPLYNMSNRGEYRPYHDRQHEDFMIDVTATRPPHLPRYIISAHAGLVLIDGKFWPNVSPEIRKQIEDGIIRTQRDAAISQGAVAKVVKTNDHSNGSQENGHVRGGVKIDNGQMRTMLIAYNDAVKYTRHTILKFGGRQLLVTSRKTDLQALDFLAKKVQLGEQSTSDRIACMRDVFQTAMEGADVVFVKDMANTGKTVSFTSNPEAIAIVDGPA